MAWRWKLFAGLAVVAVAGCASVPPAGTAPEATVKDRAQARWEALVKGEVDKAYAFISPGGRESYSLDFYRNSIRPGFWKAVEVKGVQCQPDVCEVQLDITYVLRGGTFRTPAVETWVKDNGAWWYVFKPA